MALQPFVGPWPLLQFRNLFFTQTVGLLGRGISPSHGRYLPQDNINTEQTHTDIYVLSGIRTHDPSVRASEDNSCVRPAQSLGSAITLSLKTIFSFAGR
jgi:hypothetical protein